MKALAHVGARLFCRTYYTTRYLAAIDNQHSAITGRNEPNHMSNDESQKQQDAQLSQRDRAAGCVTVFAESRRLELGDNILRTL